MHTGAFALEELEEEEEDEGVLTLGGLEEEGDEEEEEELGKEEELDEGAHKEEDELAEEEKKAECKPVDLSVYFKEMGSERLWELISGRELFLGPNLGTLSGRHAAQQSNFKEMTALHKHIFEP